MGVGEGVIKYHQPTHGGTAAESKQFEGKLGASVEFVGANLYIRFPVLTGHARRKTECSSMTP